MRYATNDANAAKSVINISFESIENISAGTVSSGIKASLPKSPMINVEDGTSIKQTSIGPNRECFT